MKSSEVAATAGSPDGEPQVCGYDGSNGMQDTLYASATTPVIWGRTSCSKPQHAGLKGPLAASDDSVSSLHLDTNSPRSWSDQFAHVASMNEEEKMEVVHDTLSSLTIDTINKVTFSGMFQDSNGTPLRNLWFEISGMGLAPWEIHRPQQVVMELARRGAFQGRTVLDMGCGIGDNALYIARYCRDAQVTAFDFVPRCLAMAKAKEALRQGMRGKVQWMVGDVLDISGTQLSGQWFDACLDIGLFNALTDREREVYVHAVKSLCKPGGTLYLMGICDKWPKWRQGGPRRLSHEDILTNFTRDGGWEVESIEDVQTEHHPSLNAGQTMPGDEDRSFEWRWRGWAESYLATIRRL